MTRLQATALTWAAVILAIVLLNILAPQPFGPFALGEIFEPYLVVTGLAAGLIAFRASRPAGRMLVVALIAIALARYLPAWVSFPPSPDAEPLRVSTLNIQAGRDGAARALEGISASGAQLMAIQELTSEAAAAFTPSATGFVFKVLPPDPSVLDVGLLSAYPVLETELSTDPRYLRAVVDPVVAEPIVVYVVHAPLGRFVMLGNVPIGVDLSIRDPAIAAIRARVDEDIAQGRSVIILGDFNSTEREPAYAQLSSGLRDAHLDAGVGPGFTWRPAPLSRIPFGLLRIDYVLSTSDLVPTSSTVDCTIRSDHCRVDVELTMTRLSDVAQGSTFGNGYFSPVAVLKTTTRSAPDR